MPIIDKNRLLGVVYLSRSPRNIMAGLYDNRQSALLAGGFVLAVALLLALLTSFAINRPIQALLFQIQQIHGSGDNPRPIERPITREFLSLSKNIVAMTNTIARRSRYIRDFAMHMSHEFKTPLTSIQGAVELIAEHGGTMSREQVERFLSNMNKDTKRMSQLVSRLLELAHADTLSPMQENCDLAVEIKRLEACYRQNSLTIDFVSNSDAPLPLSAEVADAVFTNLFENSRQHGAKEITVQAHLRSIPRTISIKDNGEGISTSNAPHLFTPFFTTKRENGGTGLGLVIIRSMLRAYGAEIAHVPSEKGAHFLISFDEEPSVSEVVD